MVEDKNIVQEEIPIEELDKFEVIPEDPNKKKGLVRLLAMSNPIAESTIFIAEMETEDKIIHIPHLVCGIHTRSTAEKERAERQYFERVHRYFAAFKYTVKRN